MTARLYYVAAVPFESARSIANLPAGHRGHNLHGHSFLARVRAQLAQGWAPFAGAEVETGRAVCGTFKGRVEVFPTSIDGNEVWIELEEKSAGASA
jgi:hypothetical protein